MAANVLEEGISKKELQPEASPPDIKAMAEQFLATFYQAFDSDRTTLGQLFRPESKLTFEGETYTGPEKILLKYISLPFKQVVHEISTYDSHLTIDGTLLIVVVGRLKTDDNPPLSFTETFNLKQFGDGLFVMNDIFRLSLHNS
ncbi:PREDICTED: nuclear transport factor 2-like [Amphimedon queenslandica]|uniref:NTF2-related export protein n=2 Tax=Amphimedon queenslandica TaxID=400682 RepID=A0A1X7TZL5_AMPQE|nr:PREDICTED: nuclear transport factor 2-like [Amphimedon queenslandica]|eukprot:XP_003389400.1 PREDICTED: nuclear transport factor 2-like [Amphimedon queenslandica]